MRATSAALRKGVQRRVISGGQRGRVATVLCATTAPHGQRQRRINTEP